MKWPHLLAIGFVVLTLNACEKHSASELNLIAMPGEKVDQPQQKPAANSGAPSQKPTPSYLP